MTFKGDLMNHIFPLQSDPDTFVHFGYGFRYTREHLVEHRWKILSILEKSWLKVKKQGKDILLDGSKVPLENQKIIIALIEELSATNRGIFFQEMHRGANINPFTITNFLQYIEQIIEGYFLRGEDVKGIFLQAGATPEYMISSFEKILSDIERYTLLSEGGFLPEEIKNIPQLKKRFGELVENYRNKGFEKPIIN